MGYFDLLLSGKFAEFYTASFVGAAPLKIMQGVGFAFLAIGGLILLLTFSKWMNLGSNHYFDSYRGVATRVLMAWVGIISVCWGITIGNGNTFTAKKSLAGLVSFIEPTALVSLVVTLGMLIMANRLEYEEDKREAFRRLAGK